MNNTNNMTRRDIPSELIANAERRRKKAQREEAQADIIEALFTLFFIILFCIALKTFVR